MEIERLISIIISIVGLTTVVFSVFYVRSIRKRLQSNLISEKLKNDDENDKLSETLRLRRDVEEIKANLYTVIDNSLTPTWIVSRTYHLVIGNSIFKNYYNALYGIEPKPGMDLMKISGVSPEELDFWKSSYDRSFAGERFTEQKTMKIGESVKYFEATFIPVKINDELANVAVMASDITSHRELIENLQKALDEKELLASQLFQSQKLESIGQLAGGIAHDFNNILTGIIGSAEFAKELTENREVSEYISEVLSSSKKATELVRRLLSFSRKQIHNIATFNLNNTVKDISRMISRLIGEDIELYIRPSSEEIFIRGDVHQIEQILINLSVNARDAMPDGGKLSIECSHSSILKPRALLESELPAGKWIELKVTDTGHGISKTLLNQIFQPFFTTKPKDKGTGLGLSMVYSIVKQHQGHIDVESSEGKGTTFFIYLPPSVDDQTRKLTGTIETLKIPATDLTLENRTILLVEDEDVVRKVAIKALLKLGYNLLQAENGVNALELVERERKEIHLLVTDLVMPQMGGQELAKTLRQIMPDIKILFTSGYTDSSKIPEIETGKTDFLQKPYTPAEIRKKILEMINKIE